MRYLLRFSILFVLLIASGCTSINSTSMTNLSSAYREVIEQYSNENILLNIVRSSKNMPMSFLDIPSVVGTGNVITDGSLSSNIISSNPTTFEGFFSPYKGSASTAKVGITVNNGFTFTQSSLDNAEFTKSFLKNLPVSLVGFKGTQQLLPRAVSYSLLIESIELQTKGNVVSRFQNSPNDPQYKSFQDLLYVLIEAGLTVETNKTKTPIGPPLLREEMARTFDNFGQSLITGMASGGVVVDKIEGSSPPLYQLHRVEEKSTMCVNKYRARDLLGELLSPAAFCTDSPQYDRSDSNFRESIANFTKNFPEQKNMTLVISLRSAGNIFNFLGRVVQAQFDQADPKMINLIPAAGVLDPFNKRYYTSQPLFKLHKNSGLNNAVASVSYKGDTYQIEDEDNSYTKSVLEFMSSLLSASKIPGSIPPSPTVIVR